MNVSLIVIQPRLMPICANTAVDAQPVVPSDFRGDQRNYFNLFRDRRDVFDALKIVGGILVLAALLYSLMYVYCHFLCSLHHTNLFISTSRHR